MKKRVLVGHSNLCVLAIAAILGALNFFSIASSYSSYLSLRNSDALAMIHALFPSYFVILPVFVMVCFLYALYGKNQRKYIHAILVIELALMLWFTPFYLSGFSRHVDGINHAAVSAKIQEVLQGVPPPSDRPDFYRYAWEYPMSFVFNYFAMQITGIDVIGYSRLVYPFFCAIIIALLWYVFASRLFGARVGFLATTIAMVALASVPEIHPSPHSTGTILALAAAILLVTFRSFRSKALGLATAFICILTHPISPIVLLIFLAAPYIMRTFSPDFRKPVQITEIGGILLGWLAWGFLHASSAGATIAQSLDGILTLKFLTQLRQLSERATTTSGAVFPEINLLDKILAYGLIVIALILVFRVLVGLNFRKGVKGVFKQIGNRMGYERLLIFVLASLCFVFAFVVVFANIAPGTGLYLERGYTWFVFAIATFIAAEITTSAHNRPHIRAFARKCVTFSILVWFVFVALVYPIVAFQTESSSGYPPSEGIGIQFVRSHVLLNNKTISIFPVSQLIPYVDIGTQFNYLPYNTLFSSSNFMGLGLDHSPDIIVFRSTTYFRVALSYDMSLEDNRYTRTLDQINNSTSFNRIYSSPTFEVYASTDSLFH